MASAEEATAPRRRKLRALVITMGGDCQEQIQKMFDDMLSNDFEPPTFSPGVPTLPVLWLAWVPPQISNGSDDSCT